MNTDILFKPFDHPKLKLANRIVMPPMTRGFSPDGIPGENVADYYARRAQSGTGLIVSEGTLVNHPAATDENDHPSFYGEKALKGWKKVIDSVHAVQGKMVPQLWHIGSVRKGGNGPFPDAASTAPSGIIAPGKKRLPAASVDDIEAIVNAFGQAALDAKNLGFDGVEVHGAHGYLIDQFFWEGTNVRDDRYGGGIEERTTFAVEIIKEIRRLCGNDFPIILRFSQWKMQDYEAKLAITPDELERFLVPLVNAGVDIFHCSTRRFWLPEFDDSNLNLAGWTKKITGCSTISVGSVSLDQEFVKTFTGGEAKISGIDTLIQRMENNEFDLIAVGRACISNPDWAVLIKENRFDELKPFSKDLLGELI